jgi:hypothetical protein
MKERLGKLIAKLWYCEFWGHHDWTSAHREGISPPSSEKIAENPEKEFWIYARMYCKRCGHGSKYNRA